MLGVSRARPCPDLLDCKLLERSHRCKLASVNKRRPSGMGKRPYLLECRSNIWGQLGRGQASSDIASSFQPQYVDVPADVKFVWVAAYNVFTLARAASGDLYCFG